MKKAQERDDVGTDDPYSGVRKKREGALETMHRISAFTPHQSASHTLINSNLQVSLFPGSFATHFA
jgi:hypothetical protein